MPPQAWHLYDCFFLLRYVLIGQASERAFGKRRRPLLWMSRPLSRMYIGLPKYFVLCVWYCFYNFFLFFFFFHFVERRRVGKLYLAFPCLTEFFCRRENELLGRDYEMHGSGGCITSMEDVFGLGPELNESSFVCLYGTNA